jgi:methylmalonyl-CoA mutase
MLASLSKGLFQERVGKARANLAEKYLAGERAIVGTTIFPAKAERPVSVLEAEQKPLPEDGIVFCERLPALRLDDLAGARA